MTEHILPDGSRIWLALGDSLSGPGDYFGRLHLNSLCPWVSINGGHWKPSTERNLHQTRLLVECCQTAGEVREAVCCDR